MAKKTLHTHKRQPQNPKNEPTELLHSFYGRMRAHKDSDIESLKAAL